MLSSIRTFFLLWSLLGVITNISAYQQWPHSYQQSAVPALRYTLTPQDYHTPHSNTPQPKPRSGRHGVDEALHACAEHCELEGRLVAHVRYDACYCALTSLPKTLIQDRIQQTMPQALMSLYGIWWFRGERI
jgi:hypothetical protein